MTTIAAVQTGEGAVSLLNGARSIVERFRGRMVGQAETELVLAFDGPARAVRCASAVVRALDDAGVDGRAGVHSGEGVIVGPDVDGDAVTTAKWAAGLAGSNEVLVSQAVRTS